MAFILATAGERQRWPVGEADRQGTPAGTSCAVPSSSGQCGPRQASSRARAPPATPSLFRQPRLVPSPSRAPGPQRQRLAATPSRDLTSQSSFSWTPGLLSGASELLQGEVPRGREAAAQQLGGDISAHQTRSRHRGEGQLGFRDPRNPTNYVVQLGEGSEGLAEVEPDSRDSLRKAFCERP